MSVQVVDQRYEEITLGSFFFVLGCWVAHCLGLGGCDAVITQSPTHVLDYNQEDYIDSRELNACK